MVHAEPDNTFANDFSNRKSLPVEGLYKNRAARVSPVGEFSNADRKWRNQWLQNQTLSPADQHAAQIFDNPDYGKARYNIFRWIWQAPMNAFEMGLRTKLGVSHVNACTIPNCSTIMGKAIVFSWAVAYYMLYSSNDWTRVGGWKASISRPTILPGDEGAELFVREHASDYGYKYHKFKNSPI